MQRPYVSARVIFSESFAIPASAGFKARRKSYDEKTEFDVQRVVVNGYAGAARPARAYGGLTHSGPPRLSGWGWLSRSIGIGFNK